MESHPSLVGRNDPPRFLLAPSHALAGSGSRSDPHAFAALGEHVALFALLDTDIDAGSSNGNGASGSTYIAALLLDHSTLRQASPRCRCVVLADLASFWYSFRTRRLHLLNPSWPPAACSSYLRPGRMPYDAPRLSVCVPRSANRGNRHGAW